MKRNVPELPFTVLDDNGERQTLSLKAIGAYTLIASLDEGRGATFKQLRACKKGGVTVLRSALDELESLGLIYRRIVRDENGRHAGTYYDFCEEPKNE